METKSEYRFVLLKATTFALAIMLLLVGIGVGLRFMFNKKQESRIAQLENTIQQMRSAINIDSIRQYNIQKVISIINDYNATMPAYEKYEIAEEIYRMSIKYDNLNVDLLCATITHETGGTWNPESLSPAGAMGLMQIMPTTGMFVATYDDINWTSAEEVLYNPIYNLRIGARYLSSLIEHYDVDGGLAAYNGGERRAALWIGSGKADGILPRETQNYVPAIQKLYEEYQDFRM